MHQQEALKHRKLDLRCAGLHAEAATQASAKLNEFNLAACLPLLGKKMDFRSYKHTTNYSPFGI